MSVYVLYYCCMKCYHSRQQANEKINYFSLCYFFLSMVFMIIGGYFFAKELRNAALTPAQSRDLNGACAIGFFDNHDLWHFASAASLFFIFMAVLTLEDKNMDSKWEDIRVF